MPVIVGLETWLVIEMPFYVIEGEPRPKVYTDLSAARRACNPSWQIHTYHSLEEASAARGTFRAKADKVGSESLQKKLRTSATPVWTQKRFEDECGVQEEEEKPGLGRWLAAQQFGDTPQFYNADQERERAKKRAEDKKWFEDYMERVKQKERKKQEARNQQGAPKSAPPPPRKPGTAPPPPRSAPLSGLGRVAEALRKLEITVDVKSVTLDMLKAAKKKIALKYHPDKQKDEDAKAESTAKFREAIESFEFLTNQCRHMFGTEEKKKE